MIEGMRLILAALQNRETYRVAVLRGVSIITMLAVCFFIRWLFKGQDASEALVDVLLMWMVLVPVAVVVYVCQEVGKSLKRLVFMDAFKSAAIFAGGVCAIVSVYVCAWMLAQSDLSELVAIRGALIVVALVLYVFILFLLLFSRLDWKARAGGVRSDK